MLISLKLEELLDLLREIAPDRNHTLRCERIGDDPECLRCRIDAALAEPGDRTLMLERQLDDALYRLAKTREALRAARHTIIRARNGSRFTVRIAEEALPHIDKVLDPEELP